MHMWLPVWPTLRVKRRWMHNVQVQSFFVSSVFFLLSFEPYFLSFNLFPMYIFYELCYLRCCIGS